jgi:hypothetical protein
MNNYGFNVTAFIFPTAFTFPGGDTIKTARDKLQNANADIQAKEQQRTNEGNHKQIALKDAGIEATQILEEGKRKANSLTAESDALAAQLAASIEQVGVDNAMHLYIVEQYNRLVEKGILDKAILTGESIFAKPFYPPK